MEETTNKSELRKLAEFIHDLTWEALPEEVRNTVPLPEVPPRSDHG